MLISLDWLKQYVVLDVPVAELERRLMMAGLNHESTRPVGEDLCIDLEVTSNRPDCLGHIGIAREAAVLWQRDLKLPAASPQQGKTPVSELSKVSLQCPELCPRFTARVIRGAKVVESPAWMKKRLATIGIAAINNIVDITNYVLMECGQPLHAYDLGRLAGREIVVREARAGEPFLAINHKTYPLQTGMCVIADAQRPVGLGGVMGGADTEVSFTTKELLIEAAEFTPSSIRNTARALSLHSDSSYRFERGIDPEGIDWASRRCCELILEIAGGELAEGVIDLGRKAPPRNPIVLRFNQLERILGIRIDAAEVRGILTALGNRVEPDSAERIHVIPPAWRRDLTREIDLIEEVGRIHGYDAIPEDVQVPMATSSRSAADRVMSKVRQVLTSAGFNEAYTISVVDEALSEVFTPWTDASPLMAQSPILRRADRLRRSLVPSLLAARRTNESLANPEIELFEIARAYLPRSGTLPHEETLLALTSGGDYFHVKGVIETLLASLDPALQLQVRPTQHPLFSPRAAELCLEGDRIGFLGEVSAAGLKHFELRSPSTVAELRVASLLTAARLVSKYTPLPLQPATSRDVNLVVDDRVAWADLSEAVRRHGGELLEEMHYVETYRSAQLGAGKKSLLMTLTFRKPHGTLTNEEADLLRDRIVAACGTAFGAQLRA